MHDAAHHRITTADPDLGHAVRFTGVFYASTLLGGGLAALSVSRRSTDLDVEFIVITSAQT